MKENARTFRGKRNHQGRCRPRKRSWKVTAHETLVHSWTVDADTEAKANELALNGCPLPDGECDSQEFEIVCIRGIQP